MLTSVSTFEKYFGQKATKKGVVQVRKLYRVAQSRKDELSHIAQNLIKNEHKALLKTIFSQLAWPSVCYRHVYSEIMSVHVYVYSQPII